LGTDNFSPDDVPNTLALDSRVYGSTGLVVHNSLFPHDSSKISALNRSERSEDSSLDITSVDASNEVGDSAVVASVSGFSGSIILSTVKLGAVGLSSIDSFCSFNQLR
jgi:hypothetical protein